MAPARSDNSGRRWRLSSWAKTNCRAAPSICLAEICNCSTGQHRDTSPGSRDRKESGWSAARAALYSAGQNHHTGKGGRAGLGHRWRPDAPRTPHAGMHEPFAPGLHRSAVVAGVLCPSDAVPAGGQCPRRGGAGHGPCTLADTPDGGQVLGAARDEARQARLLHLRQPEATVRTRTSFSARCTFACLNRRRQWYIGFALILGKPVRTSAGDRKTLALYRTDAYQYPQYNRQQSLARYRGVMLREAAHQPRTEEADQVAGYGAIAAIGMRLPAPFLLDCLLPGPKQLRASPAPVGQMAQACRTASEPPLFQRPGITAPATKQATGKEHPQQVEEVQIGSTGTLATT